MPATSIFLRAPSSIRYRRYDCPPTGLAPLAPFSSSANKRSRPALLSLSDMPVPRSLSSLLSFQQSNRIMVGNLAYETNEQSLGSALAPFGQITDVKVGVVPGDEGAGGDARAQWWDCSSVHLRTRRAS